MLRDYEQHIKRRKAQLRGDPGKEARDLLERLQKLERRRSGFLDLAADGDLSREELRGKLADLEEQREALEKTLREAEDRQEAIEKLQRDRDLVLGQFAAMRGIDLRNLSPENRRRVMQALRLRAEVDEHGDVRLSGIFDAAITELLPMAQASSSEPYRVRFRHEIPPPYQCVVTLDISRRAG